MNAAPATKLNEKVNHEIIKLMRRNPKIALRRDGKELITLPPLLEKRISTYRP
jgi:hypothetical protein